MTTKRLVIPGTVRNGVVVPSAGTPLPEGAAVEITLLAPEIPSELQAEFAAWEELSDEAWEQMDIGETAGIMRSAIHDE